MSIRVCVVLAVLLAVGSGQEYVREWQSPNLGQNAWAGCGYDLNGDGRPNLYARGGSQLIIYDSSYRPWWTIDLPGYTYPSLAFPRDIDGDGLIKPVDINGDGTGEVVVGAYRIDGSSYYGRFWVYDAVTRQLQWQSPELAGFTGYVQLDDVDGDGRHEMIISRNDYTGGWGYVEVYGCQGGGVEGPAEYGLRSSHARAVPSITNAGVEIQCELSEGGPVRLQVFDAAGREVRVLLDAELPPGRYPVRWDGRDRAGLELPAGTYHYRLATGGQAETGRLTLVR